jgi:hypothetical protein
MKKILSSLLLIFILPFTTSAISPVVDEEYEAAMFLATQGIIVNHWSADLYELDKEIQRQATIKIVMKLSWRDVPDVCRGEFSDVDTTTWPCKYIEAALDAEYIAANDTFRPFDNITMTEAMKLVLKAKWIVKTQETSNWQEDYMLTAFEYGIIDEKYYTYDANATRGWIFQIATATIEKEEEIKEIQKDKLMSDEAM